jgi:hypothetical protein
MTTATRVSRRASAHKKLNKRLRIMHLPRDLQVGEQASHGGLKTARQGHCALHVLDVTKQNKDDTDGGPDSCKEPNPLESADCCPHDSTQESPPANKKPRKESMRHALPTEICQGSALGLLVSQGCGVLQHASSVSTAAAEQSPEVNAAVNFSIDLEVPDLWSGDCPGLQVRALPLNSARLIGPRRLNQHQPQQQDKERQTTSEQDVTDKCVSVRAAGLSNQQARSQPESALHCLQCNDGRQNYTQSCAARCRELYGEKSCSKRVGYCLIARNR